MDPSNMNDASPSWQDTVRYCEMYQSKGPQGTSSFGNYTIINTSPVQVCRDTQSARRTKFGFVDALPWRADEVRVRIGATYRLR